MPVLLLCRGDAAAKDTLRKAIEARYGFRPPALETLRVDFKGAARIKIGPLPARVPLELTMRFRFPLAGRLDYRVRLAGLKVHQVSEAYDGETYRQNGTPQDDPALATTVRRFLWASAALFLMPLAEQEVELHGAGDYDLDATHVPTGDTVRLKLKPDYGVDSIETVAYHPDHRREENLVVQLESGDVVTLGDLMLPTAVSLLWGGEPYAELEPVEVAVNPALDAAVFAGANGHQAM